MIASASKHVPGMQFGVLVYGPTMMVTRRDVGMRFMKAYLRGVQTLRTGLTPRNIDIIARRSHFPAEGIRKICLPVVNPDGAVDYPSILDFQKWLVAGGNLSEVVRPEALVDMTFARTAAKELGIPPTAR